jgi:hypothetical protein
MANSGNMRKASALTDFISTGPPGDPVLLIEFGYDNLNYCLWRSATGRISLVLEIRASDPIQTVRTRGWTVRSPRGSPLYGGLCLVEHAYMNSTVVLATPVHRPVEVEAVEPNIRTPFATSEHLEATAVHSGTYGPSGIRRGALPGEGEGSLQILVDQATAKLGIWVDPGGAPYQAQPAVECECVSLSVGAHGSDLRICLPSVDIVSPARARQLNLRTYVVQNSRRLSSC